MARRAALLAAWTLAASLTPSLAAAGDPAAADALFRDARTHTIAGDYAAACPEFAESMRLDPAPGTLLNLADCEERSGHLAIALEHFLRVESWAGDREERRETAHARAVALAPRVPALTITLASDAPAGTRVFRDDIELRPASLSVPMPVEVGEHAILVTAPGCADARFVAVASEGTQTRLEVHPGAPGGPLGAAWLVGGAGVVAIGVGTFFGVRALSERSTSDATCSGGACTTAAGLSEYESARSDAVAADIALGVGIAAVAVGASMLIFGGHRPPPPIAVGWMQGRVGATW